MIVSKKKNITRPRRFNLLVIFSTKRIFLAARRLIIFIRRNIFHWKIISDHFWNRFKLIANIGDPRIISSLEVRQLEILGSPISGKHSAYELPELCMCTAAKNYNYLESGNKIRMCIEGIWVHIVFRRPTRTAERHSYFCVWGRRCTGDSDVLDHPTVSF